MNGEKRKDQRDYMRGYNRARSTAMDRIAAVLSIARAWRARALSGAPAGACANCHRWTRGAPTALWGFCAGNFEWQAGEPQMWAEPVAKGSREECRIVTREEFSCINWIPKQ